MPWSMDTVCPPAREQGGLWRPDFCYAGRRRGSESSQHGFGGSVTHCDHDRVPGGRKDIRVVVALVVLGELLGEEFTGELEAEDEGG